MVSRMIAYCIWMIGFIVPTTLLSAAWWDSDWHYRVPITVEDAVFNQTAKVDLDFASLGLSGDLDVNSIRIVKEDGTLLSQQEFTDILFNSATDTLDNSRGEVKFIMEESGSVTYYLYYDAIENGSKTALATTYAINGNFEHSSGTTPTAWSIGSANIGTNLPNNEVHNHTTEGTTVSVTDTGGTGQTRTVSNEARTGEVFHIHGYRDRQESGSQREQVWIERTLSVPSSDSGVFSYWFRIQGWDQATNNSNYDRFRLSVNGVVINPNTLSISNSNINIFSAVYGKRSSYNQYGDLGWTQATLDLSSYAGTTITVRIEQMSASDNGWKVWQLIDDVEWSLNTSVSVGTTEEVPSAELTMSKSSCVLEDPINGISSPKRIPGASIRYAIEVTNSGGAEANSVVVTDELGEQFDHNTVEFLQIQDGACDCLGASSASNNGANGTGDGETPIKLDFDTLAGSGTVKCGYFEAILK